MTGFLWPKIVGRAILFFRKMTFFLFLYLGHMGLLIEMQFDFGLTQFSGEVWSS